MFKLKSLSGRLLILGALFSMLLGGWSLSGGSAAPLQPEPQEVDQPCLLSGTADLCGSSTTSVLDMPPAAPSSSGSDSYGYTFKDSNELTPPAFDWKNATKHGTRLFPIPPKPIGQDEYNGVSNPIALPFPFKFYEQTYSTVYVDVEGLISFSSALGGFSHYENLPMPSEIPPQALIAPFWDDLTVEGSFNSTVYYTSTASYFAVQWSAVTSGIDASVPLTFEVVLYPDNSIGFYYQKMDSSFDSATVGIEDGDGVVGLQYLYNSPGLSDGLAIKFSRPTVNTYRAKAFPKLQGGLNIARESVFKVNLRNSGDFNDSYNLAVSSAWTEYALYKADGITPLIGNNSGMMAPGQLITVTLKVKAPPGAIVGNDTLINLEAVSVGSVSPIVSSYVQMRTILPAPFAMTVQEGGVLRTDMVSHYNWNAVVEYGYMTLAGGGFTVGPASNNRFIGVWIQKVDDDQQIHYLLFNSVGIPQFSPSKSLSPADVEDQNAVVAVAPNGNIAVAWERVQRKIDFTSRKNVMFHLLDQNGNPLLTQPITVTNNVTYTYGFEDDWLKFDNVRLEATSDNRFVLAWAQKRFNVGGTSLNSVDVGRAIYSASNGSQVLAPGLVFTWIADSIDYDLPGLVFFRERITNYPRILLPYLYSDTGTGSKKISYVVLNSAGAIVSGPTELSNEPGYGLDGVQLSDGNLALVWIDTHTDSPHVNLVRMSHSLGIVLEDSLQLPDGRPAAFASITADNAGNAVITWMDYRWQQRLYYAQANFANGVIGQPLIFQTINTAVGLNASSLTQGLAPYSPWWRLLLPFLRK